MIAQRGSRDEISLKKDVQRIKTKLTRPFAVRHHLESHMSHTSNTKHIACTISLQKGHRFNHPQCCDQNHRNAPTHLCERSYSILFRHSPNVSLRLYQACSTPHGVFFFCIFLSFPRSCFHRPFLSVTLLRLFWRRDWDIRLDGLGSMVGSWGPCDSIKLDL